ncbi:MAG TPA: SurA N-terminal domain-containing protein [Pseudolabrys sp.]|nr:SurA N-terminal domain-containing protein [Pseudolabrys sp.]
MLRGIHKATSNWLGKAILSVVMGLLIVSFAVWGIGDIFRGFGRNAVAKIGNTEISIEQFRQFYTDRLQQVGRQVGRAITPDQARGLGLDRQILSQIVAETTLDEYSRKLRLGLSDAEISRRITSDPSFRGANGQFDRTRFEQIIRNAGFSEPRFVDQQRRDTLRRQIVQSIIGEIKVPTIALSAINQYQNEKRNIEYLTLTPAQAGDIAAATPEALKKYFDERKVLFRAPEYRKITLLSLTPADIAKPDAVSDADAKAYYERNKNSYGAPERRELRQIVFPNAQDAATASERIAKGLSLADLAKERGLKDSDIDVGTVTKSEIIDPAVADAAFALKAGEISAPVKGSFGTVLLQVGKIEPGSQKTYEEVASQIKREQAEARARTEINNLRDKIEDERAGGSTLAETAKKLGLKSRTIEAIDRSGRAPDGKPVADLPRTPDVISTAFGSDVGVDSEALQLPNNGLLWYDVTGITPSRERTLEEVKDQVATRWRDDEIATRLLAKTDDMLGKLKTGGVLSQVASEAGLKLESASGLQRGRSAGFVPAKVVDAVFKVAKGAPGSAEGETQTQRFVFRVTEVIDPPLDANSPQAKQLSTSLQSSYSDDMIGQYIARLESDYGVSINQQALNQVIGGGTANR